MSLTESPEAESAVIFAVMHYDSWHDRIFGSLTSDDFSDPAHRFVFAAAAKLHAQRVPIDAFGVILSAREAGFRGVPDELERTFRTIDSAAGSLNVDVAIGALIAATTERDLKREVGRYEREYEATLDFRLDRFGAIRQKHSERMARTPEVDMGALIDAASVSIARAQDPAIPVVGSGIESLDAMVRLTPGIHVIAGRPSMGKTSLSNTIALHAMCQGYHVVMVPLESPVDVLGLSLLSCYSRVPCNKIQRGACLSEDEKAKLEVAREALRMASVRAHTGHKLEGIVEAIRSNAKAYPKMLVVIDYLQLMSTGVRLKSRELEVAHCTRELVQVSMECGMPIIALSQLNRQVEGRGGNRPMLSDLRESGAIEQDATSVGLLYREDYYAEGGPTDSISNVDFIVAKNRYGATGTVKLRFHREILRFMEGTNERGYETSGRTGYAQGQGSAPGNVASRHFVRGASRSRDQRDLGYEYGVSDRD